MDIWMAWNKREAKCYYCEKEIKVATPVVIGQTKRKNRTYRTYFHPQCWIDNGMAYLNNNPYTPGVRGRKRLSLTPKDARSRFLLIRRYNTLKSRKAKLTIFPDSILESMNLERRMAKIVKDMEKLGGIPPKWLEQKEVLTIT